MCCCSGVLSKALLPGRRVVTKPLNDRERFDCSQTSVVDGRREIGGKFEIVSSEVSVGPVVSDDARFGLLGLWW